MSMSTLYTGICGYLSLSFDTKGAIALPAMQHSHTKNRDYKVNYAPIGNTGITHQGESALTGSAPHRRVVEHSRLLIICRNHSHCRGNIRTQSPQGSNSAPTHAKE